MRTASRVLAATALAVLTLGGPGAPAYAGPQPDMKITPSSPQPGDRVVITVDGGCEAKKITATSYGLAGKVTLTDRGRGHYAGTGHVSERADPGGTYWVRTHCPYGGDSVVGHFIVGHGASHGSHAGTGGSVDGTAPATLAAGGALTALAAGGTVLALRRRGSGGA